MIIKNIKEGRIVLCDRHFDSTIAYQGGGRKIPDDLIMSIKRMKIFSLEPDLTFLIDLPVEISLKRLKKIDRIEAQERDFHKRVRERYLEIARKEKRVFVINGDDDVNSIHERIKDKTIQILKEKGI